MIDFFRARVSHRILPFLDQALFAVANFLLTVTIARQYGDSELSAYGIALSAALVLQGIQKNTYIIQANVLEPHIFRARARKILAQHVLATAPFAVVLVVITSALVLVAPRSFTSMLALSTLFCFLLYAQLEFERIVFLKHERYLVPFTSSCIYIIAIVLFSTVLHVGFLELLGALTIFAFLKYFLPLMACGVPQFSWGLLLLRSDLRRNSLASVLGVIGYAGYTHVPVFALGALSAPAQTAAFVAMRGVLQPIQILMRSMDIVDKNMFLSKSRAAGTMSRFLASQISRYGAASALICIVISLFAEEIVQLLYGGKYLDELQLIYAFCIINILFNMTLPVESVVVLRKRLASYNYIRFIAGLMTSVVILLVAAPFGALGVTWSAMMSSFVMLFAGLFIAINTRRRPNEVPIAAE